VQTRAIYVREKRETGWRYRNITKKGTRNSHESGPFYINILVNDKPKWHPLEASDVDGAKKLADKYDAAQNATANGLTVIESTDGTTTLKSAVEQYLKLHRNDRPKTVQQYTTALASLNILPNGFTVKQLATQNALDKVLQSLEAEGYSKKTIHTRMGIVFSLLKKFKKETGVEYASELVSIPKPVSSRPKAYSNDDVDTLWANMDGEEDLRYLFFLTTGCREQEVMHATWDDIDCDNQTYNVTGNGKQDANFVPKNHEERMAPLSTELCELLEKRRKSAGANDRWVFPNADGNPDGHFLRKLKSIAKKAGLNCGRCKTTISAGRYRNVQGAEKIDVTCKSHPVCEKHYLHRLRKTAATRWLRAGFDLETIRVWLGHKSLAVTQLYLQDESKTSKGVQARFDGAIKINRKNAA
jgi:integrase/recombinase XerD